MNQRSLHGFWTLLAKLICWAQICYLIIASNTKDADSTKDVDKWTTHKLAVPLISIFCSFCVWSIPNYTEHNFCSLPKMDLDTWQLTVLRLIEYEQNTAKSKVTLAWQSCWACAFYECFFSLGTSSPNYFIFTYCTACFFSVTTMWQYFFEKMQLFCFFNSLA